MAEFDTRADSVDVTQVMGRLRARIREQRNPDDPEQIRRQAEAARDRCFEPLRAGANRVEHNRRLTPPGRFDCGPQGESLAPEPFEFDEDTVYVSSSGGTMGKLIRLIRRLLNPILRLFFNPDPIISAMMRQAEINARLLDLLERVNTEFERTGRKFAAREELDALNYEVVSNLVEEMTRLAVDMKNHRMLVESVAARLDFDERRAQALEAVRQGRSTPPGAGDGPERAEGDGSAAAPGRTRRRRRRGRRRPGAGAPDAAAEAGETASPVDAADGSTPADGTNGPPESAAVQEPGADVTAAGGANEQRESAAAPEPAASAADTAAAPGETPPPAAVLPEGGEPPPSPSSEQTPPAEPRDDTEDR